MKTIQQNYIITYDIIQFEFSHMIFNSVIYITQYQRLCDMNNDCNKQ